LLAVHDAIEVVTLYAVEAAATVDLVPVSVAGVDSVAARAGVDVVAARAGENPVTVGVALQQVGAAAALQRVVAGVGVVGASKGVIAATLVLGHRQHRPATTNNKTSFLLLAPFSSFTAGLLPCDTFSGGARW